MDFNGTVVEAPRLRGGAVFHALILADGPRLAHPVPDLAAGLAEQLGKDRPRLAAERVRRVELHDFAGIHDHDAVRVGDGVQTVSCSVACACARSGGV